MANVGTRFRKSWNAFFGRDPTNNENTINQNNHVKDILEIGPGTSYKADKTPYSRNNARTIIASIYNRIAMDVAAIEFKHVKLDKNGTYSEDVDSYLNDCLKCEANIDQTGREFIQDLVQSMFDEGCVAAIPIDFDCNESFTSINEAKVYSMRTGKIITWYPEVVMVNVYNEYRGVRENILFPKSMCAIIENPLYAIMNEPNSTLQRLIRTIAKLDAFNDYNTSSRLDVIIQMPYAIRSDLKKAEAKRRRDELEEQLINSKYGIAYADATEKIVQLNRSLENNLWQQVKELTEQLYNQLGMTPAIFDGSANEQTMINYHNRTIEPICAAIANNFERKFITKTARTQGHAIKYFRDPFKLVPASQIADMADKLTRNEIMSGNEFRARIGLRPSSDPMADELRNKNMPISETGSAYINTDNNETNDVTENEEVNTLNTNSLDFEEFRKLISDSG